MTSAELIEDALVRIRALVQRVVDGLDVDQLAARLDPDANSIAWLVWHLTRIQDDHLSDVAGAEQAWTAQQWSERFALPFAADATGYGHGAADIDALRGITSELLRGYHDAVFERSIQFVRTLGDGDLDRVVDEAWTPPVTLGVRLVSVISDDLQHVGQAAFIRGVIERQR